MCHSLLRRQCVYDLNADLVMAALQYSQTGKWTLRRVLCSAVTGSVLVYVSICHELGSWKRAVTTADGTWQTRGCHSKIATFSIRNYLNGALLYYHYLCQKGSDDVVEGSLYPSTSKSAEGCAASITFQGAKEEGMEVAIHWQDADSSSAKSVREVYPDVWAST